MIKNKGLVTDVYEWDEEDVSSDDNDITEVKVLMALADDENVVVGKESAINGECVKISMRKKRILRLDQLTEDPSSYGQTDLIFVKSLAEDIKVSILGFERPWLSEAEGFTFPNHDTGRILPAESQVTDPSVSIADFLATEYNSADESSVCSTPLPPLEKLASIKPVSRPKTIKSILKSNFTFKADTLKGVTINEPSSAPDKGINDGSASKNNSAPTSKMKNVKTEDDSPLSIVMKELNDLKLQISKNQSSYYRTNKSQQVPQNALQNKYKTQFKRNCELCGLNNHLFENCYKVLFCKKCERTDHRTCDHAEYISTMNMTQHLKSQGGSSSRSKTSRPSKPFPHCIHYGFNDHLSDDCVKYPICDIYGSYDHDTHGKALQAKKAEAFQSKRTESSNANISKTPTKSECSRHMTGVKRYLHKYVEQAGLKVMFGDDSTCITEGYGSIKCNGIVFTKVAFVNGLKYNLVSISQLYDAKYIVQFDEKRGTIFNSNKETVMIARRYSRYTWVYFLKKKSHEPETIMSFIKRVENQNDIKIKQLRTDNGIEFRNNILVILCDEKWISQNFSSPYTPKQNGVAKKRTLIKAARTMLSDLSKQHWTEAVDTACYTQNRSTIVKRHLKTPYELFRVRIPNIDFLHVFGCLVYVHNHKDYLQKFDEKVDDGYFLGYSLVSKAFRVFNTRRQQTEETFTSHLMKTLMLSNS
ncbi:retrovirus-related pol polyprotein from transposon TNT 1-94 [Tanacetum coccineum]